MRANTIVAVRAVGYAALIAAPFAVTLASIAHSGVGYDWRVALLPAAEKVLDGISPLGGFTYPPLIPFLIAPITFVPRLDIVLGFAAFASVPVSLWLVGVRDWRCHAATILWAPVQSGLQTGNPTMFVVLAAAVAYRYRASTWAPMSSMSLAIAAKAIALPFAVWLYAVGRRRAGAGAVLLAVAVTGALFAFDRLFLTESGRWGIADVPGSTSTPSYGIADVVRGLGGGTVLGLAAICLVVAGCMIVLARFANRGDSAGAFAAAAVATLLVAPNVLLYSFSLLLLVVAVRRPTFSLLWLAPAALASRPVIGPTWQDTLVVWGVVAVVVVWALLPRQPAPRAAQPSVLPVPVTAREAIGSGRGRASHQARR